MTGPLRRWDGLGDKTVRSHLDLLPPVTMLSPRVSRWLVRLLLTSAGIKNTSIHIVLVDLLGKPIAESNALYTPTAMYAMPGGARRKPPAASRRYAECHARGYGVRQPWRTAGRTFDRVPAAQSASLCAW